MACSVHVRHARSHKTGSDMNTTETVTIFNKTCLSSNWFGCLLWQLIAVPEKTTSLKVQLLKGITLLSLQSLEDNSYRSHKGHRGWQKPGCGSRLLQMLSWEKGFLPPQKWAGGNLPPAVLPDKPGKQHEAWLMKKGHEHIYEPFIVCLD